MGRKWTDEEKKAFGEKMKAARAAKMEADVVAESAELEGQLDLQAEVEKLETQVEQAGGAAARDDEAPTTVVDEGETSTQEMMKRAFEAIANLASLQQANAPATVQPQTVQNGKLTGTHDRYSVNKNDYWDFTARLADDSTLRRFGFKENFELDWKFEVVRYQTIDNIWMQEPKITIDLNRVIYDEESGELTSGRYKEYRIVIHEDPEAAMQVARLNGMEIPEGADGEANFLNEMRFLQVRDWLRECFVPKKPTGHTNRKDMVINGKLVEYFEVNSENTQKLPFEQLDTKV